MAKETIIYYAVLAMMLLAPITAVTVQDELKTLFTTLNYDKSIPPNTVLPNK